MIETALIDGDLICYRCAAVTENDTEDIACWQVSEMMNRMLHETNAMQYQCYLTGSNNFRYDVYPEYKANRKNVPKPRHLNVVREHLVTEWKATVTDGIEADDAMGIEQVAEPMGQSVICSIDKDMLMIPGKHYNFVKQEFAFVTPMEGLRHFYWQLIMGDRTDNIFGYDGKARQKVPKFLEPVMAQLEEFTEEQDMFDFVRDLYCDDKRFVTNGKCLWILREEGKIWEPLPMKDLQNS